MVCRSSRLLAVLSGDELEVNMWHRILAWCCHRSIGGHLRPETDICATSNFSTLVSFTEPAFSGLLPLRVFESTQCASVHPGTAELDSFFFSLTQRWHRQEQKLFFTSLLWHVEQVCTFMSCLLVYHPHLTSIIVLKAVWAQACVLENKTPLSLSCIFGPSASAIVLCQRW